MFSFVSAGHCFEVQDDKIWFYSVNVYKVICWQSRIKGVDRQRMDKLTRIASSALGSLLDPVEVAKKRRTKVKLIHHYALGTFGFQPFLLTESNGFCTATVGYYNVVIDKMITVNTWRYKPGCTHEGASVSHVPALGVPFSEFSLV